MLINALKELYKKIFMDTEYVVAYRTINSEKESLVSSVANRKEFRILHAGIFFWYADPLIFTFQNNTYVFMEQYDRITCRGQIAVSTLKKNGKLSKPRTVLSEPFHMSFPMVFCHNGEVYMCPECSETGQLRIYQMQGDVYHWELKCSFQNMGKIVDTCVYESDADRKGIYLLTSKSRENPLLNERKLFWLSNDFKTIKDISKVFDAEKQNEFETRNGGKIFRYQNEKYRVQQVSTPDTYGKEVKIWKVQNCSASLFEQEEIKCISQNDIHFSYIRLFFKPFGIHTYGLENNLELVDISARSYNIKNIIVRVLKGKQNKNTEV